jgi:uncharacterized membrane protein YesL
MLTEIFAFLSLYLVLIFTDLVPVYKSDKKMEIIFCTSIFAIAFVLQFLFVFNVKLPSYADLAENILKSIAGYSGGE